jgi:hypothetical protein
VEAGHARTIPAEGLMTPVRDRAAEYREIGYRLWRLSLDRGNELGFEDRSLIATTADELERPSRRH